MTSRTKKVIAGAAIAAATVAGTGAAFASGSNGGEDGNDQPITGAALEQATAAALALTGEGKVTATEVGDEESLYEVEVTLDDGTEIDVQLDENFAVVGSESDGAGDDD